MVIADLTIVATLTIEVARVTSYNHQVYQLSISFLNLQGPGPKVLLGDFLLFSGGCGNESDGKDGIGLTVIRASNHPGDFSSIIDAAYVRLLEMLHH